MIPTTLRNDAAAAWACERPWTAALVDAGAPPTRVYLPRDAAEVAAAYQDAAAAGLMAIPVGSGQEGGATVRDWAAIDATALTAGARMDARSGIISAPAGWTWAQAAAHLEGSGWGIDHIVDVRDDATIGGTLARRGLWPALWRAGTARGAVIGLEAVCVDGSIYRYREAPRTASGPDLRALFIEAEGRTGTVTRVDLALSPAGLSHDFAADLSWHHAAAVRGMLDTHVGFVLLLPGREDARFRVRVIGDGAYAAAATDGLVELGFASDVAGSTATLPATVAVLPWQYVPSAAGRSRSAKCRVRLLGAGQTHAALACEAVEPDGAALADAWADRVVASTGDLPARRLSLRMLTPVRESFASRPVTRLGDSQ